MFKFIVKMLKLVVSDDESDSVALAQAQERERKALEQRDDIQAQLLTIKNQKDLQGNRKSGEGWAWRTKDDSPIQYWGTFGIYINDVWYEFSLSVNTLNPYNGEPIKSRKGREGMTYKIRKHVPRETSVTNASEVRPSDESWQRERKESSEVSQETLDKEKARLEKKVTTKVKTIGGVPTFVNEVS